MRTKIIIPVMLALSTAACHGKPRTQAPAPAYYKVQPDLAQKAAAYRDSTFRQLNREGLLLYGAYLPNGIFPDTMDPKLIQNYLDSHDIADAPAWHGALMIATALKMASNPSDNQDEAALAVLAQGLLKYYEITGKPGVFGRSYLNVTGDRLPWMETKEERPTKYWLKGPTGKWWRNGLAKGHFTYAVLGCGIPLMLHEQGKIDLQPATKKALTDFMIPAIRRFVAGGYRIRDWDDTYTEFGDLRPNVAFGPDWPELTGVPNGFNQLIVLSILSCARSHNNVYEALYDEQAQEYQRGIGASLKAAGEAIRLVGHSRIGKPSYSDMQLIGVAAFAYMLNEKRRPYLRGVHQGMEGLWKFMKYERNPLFTLPYFLIRPKEAGPKIAHVIRDLRDFPSPADKIAREFDKEDTNKVQLLRNRTTNSHYWKSSPFRRANFAGPPILHPKTKAQKIFSGQDYLIAYWLARFVDPSFPVK